MVTPAGYREAASHLQAAYAHRRGQLPAVRAWLEHLEASLQTHDGAPV